VHANKHEKVFKLGDLVLIHLRKEHFPTKCKNKLMLRAYGPFEVMGHVNDNAYKVDLPRHYGLSSTFNIADLSPYLDDYLSNLRSNFFKQGEDDGGLSSRPTAIYYLQVQFRSPSSRFGPCFARAQTRRFQVRLLVQTQFCAYFLGLLKA